MERRGPHLGQEFISFIKGFFSYVFLRFRQICIVLWVSAEMATSGADGLKRGAMRYVFWGRGNWYRFGVMAGIGVAVVLLPLVLKREPITTEVRAESEAVQEVAETDLLVERGSSQTLIPKGRARLEVEVYTVKAGDTLSLIAGMYPGMTVQTLLWANDLSEYDLIRPGQELKIPPGNGVVHVVEEGDTLASLAERYNAAEQAIVDRNWELEPPDFVLSIGQELFIPDGTMPPPPTPIIASTPSYGTTYPVYNAPQQPVPSAASRFLGWPVAGGIGVVTQCSSGWHTAVDIAHSSGPSLVAAAAGTVIFAGMDDPWGYAWSVQIDHGNGFTTFYAHMSYIGVVSGQYVGKGQVIGTMGATGLATGVHVHFELRNGVSWAAAVNPAPYMENHVCGY